MIDVARRTAYATHGLPSVKMFAVKIVALVVVLGVVWIYAGRQISTFLDSVWTAPAGALPNRPITLEGSLLQIGDFTVSIPLEADSGGRVSYQRFELGTRPDGGFQVDRGDEVSLTMRRSWLAWPNPFEMNFMTGHTPSWKRNTYYTLGWKKASGAKLELVWRYEQFYYSSDGWVGTMTREGSTGLIRSTITAATP